MHFAAVERHLGMYGIPYRVSHRLVRGLDYYTRTTFEILAGNIGAQNAILGGGRYDGLVKQLGGPDRVGIGFAAGIERLVLAMPDGARDDGRRPLFVAAMGEPARESALALLRDLRRAGLEAHMEYEGRSIKSQMKRADRLKAAFALILGDDELAARRGEREGHDDGRAGARLARRRRQSLPGPRGRQAGVANRGGQAGRLGAHAHVRPAARRRRRARGAAARLGAPGARPGRTSSSSTCAIATG